MALRTVIILIHKLVFEICGRWLLKSECWWILLCKLCSLAMSTQFDKLYHVLSSDNALLVLVPDNWLLSEEVQHRVIWTSQQNCTNTGCVSYYTWSLCWLLPQWAMVIKLQLLNWGNCKFSRMCMSQFSIHDSTLSKWMIPLPCYCIFYSRFVLVLLSILLECFINDFSHSSCWVDIPASVHH